jgi:hypothetical protein
MGECPGKRLSSWQHLGYVLMATSWQIYKGFLGLLPFLRNTLSLIYVSDNMDSQKPVSLLLSPYRVLDEDNYLASVDYLPPCSISKRMKLRRRKYDLKISNLLYVLVTDPVHTANIVITLQPQVKGRLLGGSSACIPIIDIQSCDHASDQALLPLSSDEDWYPLYINLASKFQEQSTECPHAREIIDRNTFQDLPTSHWKYELEAMGINFKPQARPIDQLLPSASKL